MSIAEQCCTAAKLPRNHNLQHHLLAGGGGLQKLDTAGSDYIKLRGGIALQKDILVFFKSIFIEIWNDLLKLGFRKFL